MFRKFAQSWVINFSALFDDVSEAGIKAVVVGESAGRMLVEPAGGAFQLVNAGSTDAEQYFNFF